MSTSNIKLIKDYLLNLQKKLCQQLEQQDGKTKFMIDPWQRVKGGEGITCVMEQGAVIEKCGVNFSHVYGDSLPAAATAKRPELAGHPFTALGISLIVHPRNPYAPTTHMNLRFFSAETPEKPVWWFGGGFDLTPYYGFIDDCKHWHQMARDACSPFGEHVYPHFKKWADDYFYLKHRNEARGIGGIFFDDLNEWEFDRCFEFIQSVAEYFSLAYFPILQRRARFPYTEQQREFQCYRRGRYVEFNLLYDRGTLFGLQFGGRTESILVSLPAEVSWRYNWQAPSGSDEAKLLEYFLVPRNWADE